MATGVVDAKVRQLERKAEGSNAEAPERKVQKPEEEAPTGMEEEKKQEEEGKQGVEAMFKSMMDMMKNVTTEVAGMKSEVGDVKAAVKKATATAQEAVETAQRTEGKIADIKTDIETDKKSRDLWQAGIEERLNGSEFVESAEDLKPADPEIQKKIADIEKKIAGMSGTDPWTTYKTPAGGGSGQAVVGNKDQEKRSRTITFGDFPTDTKADVIKTFIDGIVDGVKADIEETFAYGKKRSERGGARFNSKDAMWKYMTDHAGNHNHPYAGTTIYCNVDAAGENKPGDADRVKAVRKIVRLIIEKNGGNGNEVKKKIDTRYNRGIVWWKDERVAEWNALEGKMHLKGWAMQHEDAFAKLMKPKPAE